MFRRSKKDLPDDAVEPDEEASVAGHGPWDAAEHPVPEPTVDLGAIVIRGREEHGIQLPTEEDGSVAAVMLTLEESALELRAFAGPRSGGLWDEVRGEIVEQIEGLKGELEEVEGPWGTEVHAKVPVQLPDGQEGFQPSRIIGVEGPRWLLRATVIGAEGLEPTDEGVLMDALRDVVVVRGDEARMSREPLPITVPPDAVPMDQPDPDTTDEA